MNPFVPGLIAALVFALSLILVKDCRLPGRKSEQKPDPLEGMFSDLDLERIEAREQAAKHAAVKAEQLAEINRVRRRHGLEEWKDVA